MPTRREFLKRAAMFPLSAGLTADVHERAVPGGTSSGSRLRDLCERGLARRYLGQPEFLHDGTLARPVLQRLERELEVIGQLGLGDYFLVLWDAARFARWIATPATIQGPSAGSLVAYCLGVSRVCPLKYELLFERFLDLDRKLAPSVSFLVAADDQKRIVQHVRAEREREELASAPVYRAFAQPWRRNSETASLLTIDILGIPSLSVIKETIRRIKERKGDVIDLDALRQDDPKAFPAPRGGYRRCLPVRRPGPRSLLRRLGPRSLDKLIAAVALRLAPSEESMTEEYLARKRHPHDPGAVATRVLSRTNGVPLYQEQIMELFHQVAGSSRREGLDTIRALCMHRQREVDRCRDRFLEGARSNGVGPVAAEGLFESVRRYGSQAACKARATVMAQISYQMSYLKAHHRDDFEAARRTVGATLEHGTA